MHTIADTVTFILTSATDDDLARIYDAAKQRQRTLRAVAAAAVMVGMSTRLDGLSPKYLNGLTGTVTAVNGSRVTVTLDVESTKRLGYQTRYMAVIRHGRNDDGTYDLAGIPASCAKAV